mmetsp:Transcript_61055/g.122347  ORF Transcript_61055/g.122347 Transcript_61055/m.122347 type:complete len:95 (+) Transcript_61055:87-371(+)
MERSKSAPAATLKFWNAGGNKIATLERIPGEAVANLKLRVMEATGNSLLLGSTIHERGTSREVVGKVPAGIDDFILYVHSKAPGASKPRGGSEF